ncbi:MAG: 1,4-dihydroxy-2-naphthoate octaprenyltransferase, partial [Actinomycetota bacterium]|nr:1,4-dihydroxy-2-naphthoate octaprenyltransferase [Actinomycetota bacterium]
LAAVAGWWLILVGAACMAAGWLYTGGPRPYGYAGLGEVFVFVFFGLVATVGTAYVQTERIDGLAVLAAVPVGLLAVALLIVNNLRDIPGDTDAGKRTLAVRLGAPATRIAYV